MAQTIARIAILAFLFPLAGQALDLPGFTCAAPAGADGTTCTGTIPGYGRDVAIIVPTAYHPRERADVILHLHGFNVADHPLSYMLQYFEYAHSLALSGRDAVLVVPLSLGQCVDYNTTLTDKAEHFKDFMDHVMEVLREGGLAGSTDPATLTLTGHSGAYLPLSAIVGFPDYLPRIRELYLLDATYGGAEQFEVFAADPSHRFWSAYHTYDPNMNEVNPEIMSYLEARKIAYYVAPGPDVAAAQLHGNRVGFVVSDVTHDETSIRYWSMLLAR